MIRMFLILFCLCNTAWGQAASGLVHQKRSTLTNDGDITRVQISDWNTVHVQSPATSAFYWDDFIGALNTTANIGLGWSFTASTGGIANILAVANHNGIDSLGCGTIATNYIALHLTSNGNIAPFVTPFDFEMVWIVKLNQDSTDTDAHYRIGLVDSVKADTIRPNNGIYIERLPDDNSWFGVTRNDDAEDRTAALADARNVNWIRLKFRYNDSATDSVGFTVDDGTEVMAVVTNIPNSDPMIPYLVVSNSGGSANQIYLDYFHIYLTDIAR